MTTDKFFNTEISKNELMNNISDALALLAIGMDSEDIYTQRKVASVLFDCRELVKIL